MENEDDTMQPGLTQEADGTISIGPGDLKRAIKDQAAEMKREQDDLNAELASSRAPGSEAGDDGPDSKKNSGA